VAHPPYDLLRVARETRDVASTVVGTGLGVALAGVSEVRGARCLHPVGVAHRATLTVYPERNRYYGAPLLDVPAQYDAVVRMSRALGTPQGLPDVLGLAIRLLDAHGEGAHQDLLINSGGRLPLARQLFLPTGGFLERTFSSVLPYSIDGTRYYFGARPVREAGSLLHRFSSVERAAEQGRLRYRLVVARPYGMWRHVATLRICERLSDDVAESLAFDVFTHTGGGIEPAGFLQSLRRTAYGMSQRARPRPLAEPTAGIRREVA
jgi:hypothetical protein